MNIPQVRLWLDEREKLAVNACLNSGWLSEGPQCEAFRESLLELMGAKYGAFAPNGTLALSLALMALGIDVGDEVIVPDTTFVASANAVTLASGVPVFCDVDPHTFQIDVASAERAVTVDTKAVMPVHLFGSCPDMDAVMDLAQRHDLLVIEDAAQAIGVHYRGQHAGTFGDCGCFSFFCDKTLTTGEGGFVTCRHPAVYDELIRLRCHGRLRGGSFVHQYTGWNFRITDLQAALGNAQIAKLGEIVTRKRRVLGWYHVELDGVGQVEFIGVQEGSEQVPFRCVLLCEQRERLMVHLRERGIEPRTFFYPLHRQPCFGHLGYRDDAEFPNATRGWERGILLPCYPTMTREEVGYIGEAIRGFYG
jgi:perosamine synthetase